MKQQKNKARFFAVMLMGMLILSFAIGNVTAKTGDDAHKQRSINAIKVAEDYEQGTGTSDEGNRIRAMDRETVTIKQNMKQTRGKGAKIGRTKMTMAVAKMHYEEAKTSFMNYRGQLKQACRGDNPEGCEAAKGKALNHSKRVLEKSADRVLSLLDNMWDKINASTMDAEEKEDILNNIQNDIMDVETIQEDIAKAETKQEIIDAGKELRKAYKSINNRAKNNLHRKMIDVQGRVMAGFERVSQLLEKRITDLKNAGADTGDAENMLLEFNAKVSESKNLFKQGKDSVMLAKDATEDSKKGLIDVAHREIKESNAKLKQAHIVLKNLYVELKNLRQALANSVQIDDATADNLSNADSESNATDSDST